MPRTRSMRRNQPPQMEDFHAELKRKARSIERAADVTIQKAKVKKFKIPRIRLKKASERVLNPVPQQPQTPWERIREQIESGEGRSHLQPVTINIDD